MSMSSTGMKDDIVAELPDPMVDGLTKAEALAAAGGDECIQAVAEAVVDEIRDATVDTDFDTSGDCGNFTAQPGSVPAPGGYAGTIEAADRGGPNAISGMSASELTAAIRNKILVAVDGADFASDHAENARKSTAALAEAIVEEVHTNGRVSLASTVVTGAVAAVAPGATQTPTGSIMATCQVSNLSATSLRDRIINKITDKVGAADVDFDKASARTNILAIATGVVNHVHANAEVSVSTNFDGVSCPPNPGVSLTTVSSSGNVSVEDAPIS